MRDNTERFEKPLEEPIPASTGAVSAPSNPFDFALPTELVELPTKGRFYSKDHPLHGKETVEIKHMTTKEEDILTSRTLVKKGIAVDRMLESILVNRSIDIDSLFIGDKNALLVAARITGYGAEYDSTVVCPVCEEKVRYKFNLLTNQNTIPEGYEYSENGNFFIELPSPKVTVECKLLTSKDEKLLVSQIELRKKNKLPETLTSDLFKLYVVSVNGKPEYVNKLIEAMPAKTSVFLKEEYRKRVPNIDLTQKFVCPECDCEADVEVPLTAEFFWFKR